MTTPRQPAPSRESLRGGCASPAPAPGIVGTEPERLRCTGPWRPGARRLGVGFLPLPPLPTATGRPPGLEANRPRLTQITAGAPGNRMEAEPRLD